MKQSRVPTPAVRCAAVLSTAALLCVPMHAEVLTLGKAEHAAATTGFATRARHFEERTKEWEKWNAVAGYLPTVDYQLTYLRMDRDNVEAIQSATSGFGDILIPNDIRLDTLERAVFGDTLPSMLYTAPPQPQSDAAEASSPFAAFERSWKHEFKINQPITNGGLEVMAIGIANHTKKAIELQQEAGRQQAIYGARKAYFDALSARERTLVAQQTLAWNQRNLEKARVRQDAGAIPITDVLQWEADVAEKEGELQEARAVARLMVLNLHQAMGVPLGKADTLVALQPLEVFEAWYDRGMAQTEASVDSNLTLRMVREYTEVSRQSKGIAVGKMLPQLNAFLNYGWPSWREFLPPENTRTWTAGVLATVHLFQGFKGLTELRKTRYQHMQTQVEEDSIANLLAINIDRIGAFYRAAYAKVAASRRQMDLMAKQLEIMQQRYDAGLVNQSQLLEVELGARNTRIGYIMALFECLLYEAEYHRETGSLEVTS